MKYLQVVDGSVQGAFLCPQDETHWPDLIEVADDDPRYLAYIENANTDATAIERTWRDTELARMVWLRDRHRDQVEMETATTLHAEQYSELLVYLQALRDWPQSDAFPDAARRPVAPTWSAEQRM
jgi:hypothetical protein